METLGFDKAESTPLIKHALDCGINFIDLADFYSAGVGEEVVGRIVKNLMSRDELVLTTKVGYPIGHGPNNQGHSRKHIMASIDASLKRLGTDYIDIYMLHYFDINTPVEETWSAMNDIIHSGKARYTGVSTMFTWQLSKIYGAANVMVLPNRSICNYSLTAPTEKKSGR